MLSILDFSFIRWALICLFLVILFGVCEHFFGDDGSARKKEQEVDIETRCPLEVAKETIFVLIPSLNEAECGQLIFDLFENALCPKRVFIGLVQNVDYTIDSAIVLYEIHAAQNNRIKFTHNIRRMDAVTRDAMGFLDAYETGRSLYRDEMFSMVIHAHTKVVKSWDELSILELKKCSKAGRAAIITYCPNQVVSHSPPPPSMLTLESINIEEALVFFGALALKRFPDKPVPANFWTSKFAFGYGSMMKVTIPSSTLRCLPDVQDLIISIKLWAKGYQFFTPTKEIVYHCPPSAPRTLVFDAADTERYDQKLRIMHDGITVFKSFFLTSSEAISFAKYLGINFAANIIPRDVRLGITPLDDRDEIALKERVLLLKGD
jgi:hypothetical protein